MKNLFPATMFLSAALSASADVKLNELFADHMVLQRDLPVAVFGAAEPNEKVTVAFAGQEKSGAADKDGRWMIKLDAMKAAALPAVMTVTGKNKLTLNDVVVGDVWICSGQSNMDFTPGAYHNALDPLPYDEKDFDFPLLRQFHLVNEPSMRPETGIVVNRGNGTSEEAASWLPCKPTTGNRFTAVGLYFGRRLQQETGVPIGLIKTAWNGTRIEPWISPAGLASVSELPPVTGLPTEYKSDGGYPSTWHCLFNGKIHPLTRYGIKGAIWYQGESNGDEGETYYQNLRALIGGWRTAWGQGDFPFYIVQLANFKNIEPKPENIGKDWAKLREAQAKALAIPNTGLAVTVDIGESEDIHPINKQDIGKRLALWALAGPYGKDITPSGPLYKSHRTEGSKIRVAFDHAKNGLMTGKKNGLAPVEPDASAELRWFEIAGEDRVFKSAQAVIQGSELVISCPDVPSPVAARYAFVQDPAGANLYNTEGLPASPFRTDSW